MENAREIVQPFFIAYLVFFEFWSTRLYQPIDFQEIDRQAFNVSSWAELAHTALNPDDKSVSQAGGSRGVREKEGMQRERQTDREKGEIVGIVSLLQKKGL